MESTGSQPNNAYIGITTQVAGSQSEIGASPEPARQETFPSQEHYAPQRTDITQAEIAPQEENAIQENTASQEMTAPPQPGETRMTERPSTETVETNQDSGGDRAEEPAYFDAQNTEPNSSTHSSRVEVSPAELGSNQPSTQQPALNIEPSIRVSRGRHRIFRFKETAYISPNMPMSPEVVDMWENHVKARLEDAICQTLRSTHEEGLAMHCMMASETARNFKPTIVIFCATETARRSLTKHIKRFSWIPQTRLRCMVVIAPITPLSGLSTASVAGIASAVSLTVLAILVALFWAIRLSRIRWKAKNRETADVELDGDRSAFKIDESDQNPPVNHSLDASESPSHPAIGGRTVIPKQQRSTETTSEDPQPQNQYEWSFSGENLYPVEVHYGTKWWIHGSPVMSSLRKQAGTSSQSLSTLGGLVKVDAKVYGLTAGHPHFCQMSRAPTPGASEMKDMNLDEANQESIFIDFDEAEKHDDVAPARGGVISQDDRVKVEEARDDSIGATGRSGGPWISGGHMIASSIVSTLFWQITGFEVIHLAS